MRKVNRRSLLALIIFSISTLLSLGLTLVNRDANDNHMYVIRYTLLTGKLTQADMCTECFQPKLYHYTAARIISAFGIDKADREAQKVAAQLINFSAGLIILLVSWAFISRFPTKNDNVKLFAFALLAFNPALIGINAQATNDTYVILFSTLALYCTFQFIQSRKLSAFALAILFTTLTVSSKANGWVIAIAILGALVLRIWTLPAKWQERTVIAFLFLISVPSLAYLNPLNQYALNYRKYGSPVITNVEGRPPPPKLFTKTSIPFPGILSIQDGYFTFKFWGLMKYPASPCATEDASVCTSLWTQLYARANSVHFFNYPPTWIDNSEAMFMLTRSILILALPIAISFLLGAAQYTLGSIRWLFSKSGPNDGTFLTTLTAWGYIAFIILYTYMYREISFMKPIFIFPGLLAFLAMAMAGLDTVFEKLKVISQKSVDAFQILLVGLLALYATDVVTLILQLGAGLQ